MPKRISFCKNHPASADQYYDILNSQLGRCAVCLGAFPYKLLVDHNHDTKKVRGLLCCRCNSLVGYVEKSKSKELEHAISYLEKHGAKSAS